MQTRHLLIVDDEKNIRMTLTQCLETLGYQVDTALNGEEALGKIDQQEYDLVLLDLKMPGISGMEVIRQISGKRPGLKVIVITAHGTIETAVEAMKLGAVDFVQKPFAPQEIRELVRKALGATHG